MCLLAHNVGLVLVVGSRDESALDAETEIWHQVNLCPELWIRQGWTASLWRFGSVRDGPLASGAFYRPSLIEAEDLDAPIIQQEIFRPVATFEVFDDEKDAIHRANATEFGLAAAVFTRDVTAPAA
jgi:hypothetical protein